MGSTLLRADFWRLSGLAARITGALVIELFRMGMVALVAMVVVFFVARGGVDAESGSAGVPTLWLVSAPATLGSLWYVSKFFDYLHDDSGGEAVNIPDELASFVVESTTYDSASAERWSADVPGTAAIAGLVIVAFSLLSLALLLPIVAPGDVGVLLVLLSALVAVVLARSDVDPVRPLSEQVGYSLGGALIGVALWLPYNSTLLSLGAGPAPLASLVAFPVVGVVVFYCLLLADDAARVRQGTYPPEADADLADADLPDHEPVRPFGVLASRLPDVSLRTRLAATLGAVLLVNLAIVAAVTWAASRLVSAVGRTIPVSMPVVIGAVLVCSILLVVAEARYGYRRALAGVSDEQLEPDHEVSVRVRRFAQLADVPAPSVALVESTVANSFTVGNGTDVTVVVTTGLLETLTDAELDAVLAHEVAHVANRDPTVTTVVATLSAVSGSLRQREKRLADQLQLVLRLPMTPSLLAVILPRLLIVPVYVAVSVVARAFLACNAVCVGLHARTREYAADRAAAGIVGDPSQVAAALESLASGGSPETDARLNTTAVLGIVPQARRRVDADSREPSRLQEWFPTLLEETEPPTARFLDRVGRALEWRPTTHPPTEERVRRLRRLHEP